MRFSLDGLRFRLLLLVLLAVIPALGLILYTGLEQRRVAAANAQTNALRLARLASNDHTQLVETTRQLLITLSRLPEVRASADPAVCQSLVADLIQQFPYYADLGVVWANGDWFCRGSAIDPAASAIHQAWFQRATQTREFVVSDYQVVTRPEQPSQALVHFAYPILDEREQLRAVAVAVLDLDWLSQLFAALQLPDGAVITLVDPGGRILARQPEASRWVGQIAPEGSVVEVILLQQAEGTAEAHGVDGVPRLYAFAPLETRFQSGEVYLYVGIPAAAAYAEANQTLAFNLAGLAVVIGLSLAAAWFGGDLFVLRPVNALVAATRRLTGGDLGARLGIPHGSGELGHLARAFDEMAAALQAEHVENERLFRNVHRLAVTDELTGLHNRRHFFLLAGQEFQRMQRFGYPLSALMLDIDHFKRINDTYGHAGGDQILRAVAERCMTNIRSIDILGRYGGEEFAVLLPETDVTAAHQLADRLVTQIAGTPFTTTWGPLSVTVSLGVASVTPDTSDLASLLAAADQAMYLAKQGGRNRVAMR